MVLRERCIFFKHKPLLIPNPTHTQPTPKPNLSKAHFANLFKFVKECNFVFSKLFPEAAANSNAPANTENSSPPILHPPFSSPLPPTINVRSLSFFADCTTVGSACGTIVGVFSHYLDWIDAVASPSDSLPPPGRQGLGLYQALGGDRGASSTVVCILKLMDMLGEIALMYTVGEV